MLAFEKCMPSRVLFTASLANLLLQHFCRIAGAADTTVLEVSLRGQVSGMWIGPRGVILTIFFFLKWWIKELFL